MKRSCQLSVTSCQLGAPPVRRPWPPPTGHRQPVRGFTLVELLVVIGIIALVAIIAVPAFRAMTGSRSTEAAQNQISAVLARARTEALGVEEPRGILFYRDLDTQRIGMISVRPANTAPPYELDLVPDRDPVLLPDGVGIQFIDDLPDDRYIGFNTRVVPAGSADDTVVPYGGVVLFDRQGRVTVDGYGFRIRYPASLPSVPLPRASEMGRFLYNNPVLPIAGTQVVIPAPTPAAKLGFVLFDAEAFSNQFREGRGANVTEAEDHQVDGRITPFGTVAAPPSEAAEEDWLNSNSVPVLVNRYNGTLIRGE